MFPGMFPGAIPPVLRSVAEVFPLTHAVLGTRLARLRDVSFAERWGALGGLALYALLPDSASLYVFLRAIRKARRRGTLPFS